MAHFQIYKVSELPEGSDPLLENLSGIQYFRREDHHSHAAAKFYVKAVHCPEEDETEETILVVGDKKRVVYRMRAETQIKVFSELLGQKSDERDGYETRG